MSTLDTTNITISKILITIGIFILVGVIGFHLTEGRHRFDSLYYTITTLATIGLGDLVPHTVGGKILTMLYAIMGVPLFVTLSGYILREILSGQMTKHIHTFLSQHSHISITPNETHIDTDKTEIIKE